LFSIADLAEVPLVGPVFAEVAQRYPGIDEARLIHESIRRLIDRMVGDLIGETARRLADSGVRSATTSAISGPRWPISRPRCAATIGP